MRDGTAAAIFWGVIFVLYFLAMAYTLGSCSANNPDRVLSIACKSACERRGSEMALVQENVCLCKNLTAMSGDYGQLFLKGDR